MLRAAAEEPSRLNDVLITVDTELSPALHQRGATPEANLASSIFGQVGDEAFGISWQMDRLDAHGLTGVYFIDPMPALVYGEGIIRAIVAPVLERGHEVQLHLHPEWLQWTDRSPVGDRRGSNIGDFDLADQRTLLGWGLDLLEKVGAPRPIAFRAGNYGADDRTLEALAGLGLRWDSSFNPAYVGASCRIGLDPGTTAPVQRLGISEIPVAGLFDRGTHVRPAQVCALSAWEMRAALGHASRQAGAPFAIVTHSFEMLSRDRRRANRSVIDRFERMCAAIAAEPELRSTGFVDLDPTLAFVGTSATRLPPNPLRTAARIAEQVIARLRYE